MPFAEDAAIGRVAEGDEPEAQIVGHDRCVASVCGAMAARSFSVQAAQRLAGQRRQQSARRTGHCPQELTQTRFRHNALPAKIARDRRSPASCNYMSSQAQWSNCDGEERENRRHRRRWPALSAPAIAGRWPAPSRWWNPRVAPDRARAEALLTALLPDAGRARRIGISGAPGAGKSTFIEAFGGI